MSWCPFVSPLDWVSWPRPFRRNYSTIDSYTSLKTRLSQLPSKTPGYYYHLHHYHDHNHLHCRTCFVSSSYCTNTRTCKIHNDFPNYIPLSLYNYHYILQPLHPSPVLYLITIGGNKFHLPSHDSLSYVYKMTINTGFS